MPQSFTGSLEWGSDRRLAIVVSQYNDNITRRLLEGALVTLNEAGVPDDRIAVAWVPGAWELPLVAQQMARRDDCAAVICLGAVIRGETTHDQYINQQVSHSLGQIALQTARPIVFGVLTCNTLEQALQRAGGNQGNKGAECARAALQMVTLLGQLRNGGLAE
jgi:6,7-dimethyl-8-ribityllumazine synthase